MENEELNFVPAVYDILKCVEKDSTAHDLSQKVSDLKHKLQKAREIVEKLPGIDYSKEEQEHEIEIARQQLVNKTELLRKYKNDETFELKQ